MATLKKVLLKDPKTGEYLIPVGPDMKAFTEYEGIEPPTTLEFGTAIITQDNKVYVGGVGNVPIDITGGPDLSEFMESVVGTP